jgi:uncharacterized protein with GYD domain
MPKFLVTGSYSAEGLRGLTKDKASGRQTALKKAFEALGGTLEGLYYALGDADVYVLCDCPDNVSIAALSVAASASGLVRTKTVALLTVEEMDRALAMKSGYRAPGAKKAAKG